MSGPNGDPDISADNGIIEDDDEFNEEGSGVYFLISLLRRVISSDKDRSTRYFCAEYAAIDSMLDQISCCLDAIEQRNEDLTEKLHELLESNREARRQFRENLQNPRNPPEQDTRPHPPEDPGEASGAAVLQQPQEKPEAESGNSRTQYV
ncbi:hypothetical protein DNTS_003257 [Danionella cerebrum]|uniref:Uncharacterized protein n=1 Tax=Danionella cerebrum TaxID=2873325 RepID=A0A553MVG0_9TELE|nr:hypothetical protein DNTS_003257 [Danionella translucida]